MNKLKIKFLVNLVLYLVFAQRLQAQSVDLRLLTETVESDNFALKRADNRIEFQRTSVATAFEKPKLQLEGQVGNIQNPFVVDYTVGAQQMFENPSVYRAKYAYLEAGVFTAEMQKKWERKELILRLSETYFSLAHTHRLIQLIQKQDSLLLQVKKVAEAKYQMGATDKIDVAEVSVIIGKNQLRQTEMHAMYAQYEKQLKNILGGNFLPKLSFSTQDSLYSPLFYFLQGEPKGHPAKQWMQAEIEEFGQKVELEKKRLSPDFTLGVMNQSMQGSINQWVGLGGISIPIDKKPQKAKIQLAQLEKYKAELNLRELEVLRENEWRSLYKEWTSTYERINTLEKEIIPSLHDLRTTSFLKYKLGEQDFFRWNAYQQQYLEALQIHSEALKSYYVQLAYFNYLNDDKQNEK